MSRVNGIGYIITAIGGVISAITLFYKAFNSNKQSSFANLISQKDQEIKQKAEDAELYRKRWLKAETENDKLKVKIEKLRKELNKKNDD